MQNNYNPGFEKCYELVLGRVRIPLNLSFWYQSELKVRFQIWESIAHAVWDTLIRPVRTRTLDIAEGIAWSHTNAQISGPADLQVWEQTWNLIREHANGLNCNEGSNRH